MRKLSAKWNDTDKPWLLEWIILGFIVSFCFIMFNHPDILATSTHGMDLLDITLKGRFFDFYDYTESTAVYHILIYIIFAVSAPLRLSKSSLFIPKISRFLSFVRTSKSSASPALKKVFLAFSISL